LTDSRADWIYLNVTRYHSIHIERYLQNNETPHKTNRKLIMLEKGVNVATRLTIQNEPDLLRKWIDCSYKG